MVTAIVTKKHVLIALLALLGLWIGLLVYHDAQRTAAFNARLEALARQGPDVVTTHAHQALDARVLADDVAAIQAMYQQRNTAWCQGDGTLYASGFTPDADFISFDGTHTIGRDEIASSHQQLFDTWLDNTCLVGEITRIKFLAEDTAIVYTVSGTVFDDSPPVRRPSIQTHVVVKQDGAWLFTTFHNGRIDRVEERNLLRQMMLGIQTAVFRR